jgi:hypothetical protein
MVFCTELYAISPALPAGEEQAARAGREKAPERKDKKIKNRGRRKRRIIS